MLGEKDGYYASCKPLIEDIESKRKIAVVSHLVIIEAIHVLRQRIIEKSRFAGDDRTERDRIIDVANAIVGKFVSMAVKLSKEKKIIIARPDRKIHEHHCTVMKKMKGYFGHVRTVSMCPYCEKGRVGREDQNVCPSCKNSRKPLSRHQYKALGHADIERAYFASYHSVPLFCSTDKSFRDLKNDSDFGRTTFQVIPHPSTRDRFQ